MDDLFKVPSMDIFWTIVCIILDFVIPGVGTIIAGLINDVDGVILAIGLLQIILNFAFIGIIWSWIWSILWILQIVGGGKGGKVAPKKGKK